MGQRYHSTYGTDWSMHGITKVIVPYCNSIKGITQRTTDIVRRRDTSLVVINTIERMCPLGFVVVTNFRASVVHSDRLWRYVLRSRPVTEKVEDISRRIFNPGSDSIVSILFLGRSGARATHTPSGPTRKLRPSGDVYTP